MATFLKKSDQRGLSLVEMAIVVATMGLVVGAVMKFTVFSKTNLIDLENRSELTRFTQRISQNLRGSVKTAHLLLHDYQVIDATGTTYLTFGANYGDLVANSITNTSTAPLAASSFPVSATSSAPTGVPWARLSLIVNNDSYSPSTPSAAGYENGQPYIGNQINFAAHAPPLRVFVDTQANPGGDAVAIQPPSSTNPPPAGAVVEDVAINRYQFVSFYMAGIPNTRIVVQGNSKLAVVEWRSLPFIGLDSVNYSWSTSTGKQRAIIDYLVDTLGYRWAWDDTGGNTSAAQSFFFLRSTGTPSTDMADYLIRADTQGIDVTSTAEFILPTHSWAYVTDYSYRLDHEPDLNPVGQMDFSSKGAGVSGYPSDYMVAYNTLTDTAAGLRVDLILASGKYVDVPRFAKPSVTDLLAGFPAGFEVYVAGSAGNRKVYLYTTMIADSAATKRIGRTGKNQGLNTLGYLGSHAMTMVTVENLK